MAQLLKMAGCILDERTGHDGTTPLCDENGATSVPGIYAVGDVSGIEEASSAMIEGESPDLPQPRIWDLWTKKNAGKPSAVRKKRS